MRTRTTLVLLALFVAAAAYVLLVERKKPTEDQVAEKEKALLTLEPKEVRRIRIETAGRVIAAERSDTTNWVLTEPVRDRAENSMLESVLSQLKALKADRVFAPGDSMEAYGLSPPDVTVRLETGKGERTLEVGDKTPTGNGYFVRVDRGSQVGVIGAYIVDGQIRKPPADFRDKRLADFALERARRITLESAEAGRVELSRETGEGPWTIVSPVALEADAASANNVVNRFRFLRARDFVDEPSGDYGFERPSVRLAVTLDDGSERTLTLGREEGEDLYAQVSGRSTVYLVPAATRTDLAKGVNDLREKRIMAFEPENAASLTLAAGGTTVTAEKDTAGAWRFAGEPGRKLVSWRIEDPIRNLSLLRAEVFPQSEPPAPRTGLDRPALEATVTLRDGTAHTARFGASEEGRVYASGERGPRVVLVSPTAMNQLLAIINDRPYEATGAGPP